MQSPNVPVLSRTVVKCCCGKICKGARGFKMHQRSCQMIHGLNDELCADLEEQITANNTEDTPDNDNNGSNIDTVNDGRFPELKKGIKLPKNDSELLTANDYFKCALQLSDPITLQDTNSKIKLLNNTIYNYFEDNFGHAVTVPDNDMVAKYKDILLKS